MLSETLQDGEMSAAAAGSAAGWDASPADPRVLVPNLTDADVSVWEDLRGTVRMLAADERWSMGEVARRSGVGMGIFSPWYGGRYRGAYPATAEKLSRWLRADEERRTYVPAIAEPGFVETRTALDVLDRLLYAQELPGMALIVLGAGMGKTATIRHAVATRPHVHAITASPSVRTVPAVARALAHRLDLVGHPGQMRMLIGERLARSGQRSLLIVDEAQNLADEAVDELRHYRDEYGCGLALLGNHDVIGRWGGTKPRDGYGQVQRRISIRLTRLRPIPEDIDLFLSAWGIEDPEVLKLLRTIGQKAGALGQIAETVKLAAIKARGEKRMLEASHVRWAWAARADGGGL